MVKRKNIKGLFLGVAAVLAVTAMPALPANAGYSENIIDGTSCEKELNGGTWYNPDEDVTGKNGMIIFDKDSTDASRVITKELAQISEQSSKLLSAKFTLDFSAFPNGKEFIFAMGLQSVAAMSGEQGNLEVVFGNKGGTYVKVLAYEEAGKATELLKKTNYSGNSPKVEVELSTKKTMTLSVNGKEVYKGKIPFTGEGSMGFMQTGGCAVKVKDLRLSRFSYERPEAPDFEEDFEDGYFNANLLKSKALSGSSYAPSYMKIEDYKGSKVLKLNNTGIAYVSTKYKYSNFEMTFDIPYYQHESVYNEKGEVTTPASRELAVCFGAEGSEHTNEAGYTQATDLLVFNNPSGAYNIRTNESFKSDIPQEESTKGKGFSVKLSVLDGQVTLAFRFLGEKAWHTCVSYKLTFTPTGNIAIWAPTGGTTTYAIDNIKVVNKDKDAIKPTVEYKSSKIEIPSDFQYTPQGLNYNKDAKVEKTEATVSYMPVYVVGAACAVLLLLTAVLCFVNKKKGVQTDEKR